jgi:hypothetical protein
MGFRSGSIYNGTLGRFLSFSVVFILLPGTLTNEHPTTFTFSYNAPYSPSQTFQQKSDTIPLYPYSDKPVTSNNPKERVQGSSSYVSQSSKKSESATSVVVSTQFQTENLLDQGYSVNDIANELQLTRKEVRKLKRQLKKEEKAAIQLRKKERRKKEGPAI